jgi:hypothetical protein
LLIFDKSNPKSPSFPFSAKRFEADPSFGGAKGGMKEGFLLLIEQLTSKAKNMFGYDATSNHPIRKRARTRATITIFTAAAL